MPTFQRVPLLTENPAIPLHIYYIDALGSTTHTNYRELLRSQLVSLLTEQGLGTFEHLTDLKQKPNHPKLLISLSHAPTCSIISWIDKKHRLSLGADIEDVSRIQLNIISRIATKQEIQEAPHPYLLWSAKEAAIKSFSADRKVMSSVDIINWKPLQAQTWTFALKSGTSSVGYGEVCLKQGHSIAFFTSTT